MAGEIAPGHAKSAGIVGILICIMGSASFIVGIVWASFGGKDAQGIWNGVLLLLAAIFGIVTWAKKSKITMIFFLVFCIIDIITSIVQAAIAALAYLIWHILAAIIDKNCKTTNGRCECGKDKVPLDLENCDAIKSIGILFLVILIFNALAVIFTFAGSIIGCMATCCAKGPQQTGVVMVVQQ